MSQSDDELRDILFKAAGGISDMATDEIAQIKRVFAANHTRQTLELLEGLRFQMIHTIPSLPDVDDTCCRWGVNMFQGFSI